VKTDEEINDLILSVEKATEDFIRNTFVDGLLNENDQVYIRVVNGRLMWLRGNKYGGGEGWNELTPNIAKAIESGATVPAVPAGTDVPTVAIQEPETYEIGWYQDNEGDLYQFDGKTWLGKVPSKKEIDSLEFLG
jgi:hypothetical protein